MAFIYTNINPTGRVSGDCAVRAVAIALGIDWEQAYARIAFNGFQMGDVITSNATWGSVLRQSGFKRYNLPTDCPDCYTVREFCREHPHGVFVLGTGSHAVAVIDGDYFDVWDSGDEIVAYVWYKD